MSGASAMMRHADSTAMPTTAATTGRAQGVSAIQRWNPARSVRRDVAVLLTAPPRLVARGARARWAARAASRTAEAAANRRTTSNATTALSSRVPWRICTISWGTPMGGSA